MKKNHTRLAVGIALFALAGLCFPSASSAQGVEEVYYIQLKLKSLGYDVGEPDGISGRRTKAALGDLAQKTGFESTLDGMLSYFAQAYYRTGQELTDEGELEGVRRAFEETLLDPFSAQFKDVVLLPTGNVCGQVNAKNTYGAFVGFRRFFALSAEPIVEGGDRFVFLPQIDDDESRKAEYLCLLDVDMGGLS